LNEDRIAARALDDVVAPANAPPSAHEGSGDVVIEQMAVPSTTKQEAPFEQGVWFVHARVPLLKQKILSCPQLSAPVTWQSWGVPSGPHCCSPDEQSPFEQAANAVVANIAAASEATSRNRFCRSVGRCMPVPLGVTRGCSARRQRPPASVATLGERVKVGPFT
jgi:hypothetical protein